MSIEWYLEPHKGWALDVPVVTEDDGTKYTPLDPEWWRKNAPPALLP